MPGHLRNSRKFNRAKVSTYTVTNLHPGWGLDQRKNCAYTSHVLQVSYTAQVTRQVSLLGWITWEQGKKLVLCTHLQYKYCLSFTTPGYNYVLYRILLRRRIKGKSVHICVICAHFLINWSLSYHSNRPIDSCHLVTIATDQLINVSYIPQHPLRIITAYRS